MCAGVCVCVCITWSRYFVYQIYWVQLNQLGDLKASVCQTSSCCSVRGRSKRKHSASLTCRLFLLTGVAGAPQQWPQCSPTVTWFLYCKSVMVPYFLLDKLQSSFLLSAVLCQLASTAVTSAEDMWVEFEYLSFERCYFSALCAQNTLRLACPLSKIKLHFYTQIQYSIFLPCYDLQIFALKPPNPLPTLNLMRVNLTPGAVKFPLSCQDKRARTHTHSHTALQTYRLNI